MLETLGAIELVASIAGLGQSLVAWYQEAKARGTDVTVRDYQEWLRRNEHVQLLTRLDESGEQLQAVERIIMAFAESTSDQFAFIERAILSAEQSIMDAMRRQFDQQAKQLTELSSMLMQIQAGHDEKRGNDQQTPKVEESFFAKIDGNVYPSIRSTSGPKLVQYTANVNLINNLPTNVTIRSTTVELDWKGEPIRARVKQAGLLTVPRRGGAILVGAATEVLEQAEGWNVTPTVISISVDTLQKGRISFRPNGTPNPPT